MAFPIRNTAWTGVDAQLIDATTGAAYVGTVTCYVNGDDSGQVLGATASGICVAAGRGVYVYSPTAAETNYGKIAFTFTGSGAINQTITIATQTAAQAAAVASLSTPGAITVSALLIAAIQRVTSGGDLPASTDLVMALARFNDLLDAWKIEGLTTFTITRTTWALTSASSYSVGSTGTIAINRPINAQSLDFGLLDSSVSPAFERRMINFTDDQYHSIGFKSLTAPYPQGFYYNPTTPTGTISPWPIPTASTLSGVIYAPAPAGEVGLSDTLVLPAGYRRFYRDNLAVELAPDFDLMPSPVLVKSADDSKAMVKRANVRLSELMSEAASLGGGHPSWNQSAFYAGQ